MKRPRTKQFGPLGKVVRRLKASGHPLVSRGAGAFQRAYAAALDGFDIARDPMRRSFLPLRLLNPERLHQAGGDTAMDRFPAIFAACRRYLGDGPDLNLLSFGCSTGEEVLTLRRYFPSATLTGAEINRRSLAICRSLPSDDRIHFVSSELEHLRARGPYHAIFALAVLQRHAVRVARDRPVSLKGVYPFERFDAQITDFSSLLRPSGLLVIHAKMYPLSEASAAADFVPLEPGCDQGPDGPKYDRHSIRFAHPPPGGSIFIKKAAAAPEPPL